MFVVHYISFGIKIKELSFNDMLNTNFRDISPYSFKGIERIIYEGQVLWDKTSGLSEFIDNNVLDVINKFLNIHDIPSMEFNHTF